MGEGRGAGPVCANTELSAIIINELRETYGIKYRKEKKQKSLHVRMIRDKKGIYFEF